MNIDKYLEIPESESTRELDEARSRLKWAESRASIRQELGDIVRQIKVLVERADVLEAQLVTTDKEVKANDNNNIGGNANSVRGPAAPDDSKVAEKPRSKFHPVKVAPATTEVPPKVKEIVAEPQEGLPPAPKYTVINYVTSKRALVTVTMTGTLCDLEDPGTGAPGSSIDVSFDCEPGEAYEFAVEKASEAIQSSLSGTIRVWARVDGREMAIWFANIAK